MAARVYGNKDHELSARQDEILVIVKRRGFATIEALARHFDVSTQTIRRDIIHLDRMELLRRFHGGAGVREAASSSGQAECRFTAAEIKERLARLAVEHIDGCRTIFLDGGTTVEAVARALRGRQNLRVFTASIAAATILAGEPDIQVFVTGGVLSGPDGGLTDEWTNEAISRFRFDVAILGFGGVDEDGALMDFDLARAAVKRFAAARAARVIAVGEGAKLQRPAVVRALETARLDVLVTNGVPPPPVSESLKNAGVEVVCEDA